LKWGLKIENLDEEFNKIDINKGGFILFDEFSHYAISKSIALEEN
jgi:hypothetical protein